MSQYISYSSRTGSLPSTYATIQLNNLGTTAINAALLPGVNGTIDLGTSTGPKAFRDLIVTSGIRKSNNVLFYDIANNRVNDDSGNASIYPGAYLLRTGAHASPVTKLDWSGSANIIVGNVAGTVAFKDTSLAGASTGYVWTLQNTTTGVGAWAAASGGANTALSNLAATAVNVNLRPNGSNNYNLGDSGNRWNTAYISTNAEIGAAGAALTIEASATPAGHGDTQAVWTQTLNLGLYTNNNTANDSTSTKNVYIESGNKTDGTGSSGDISAQTGTSVGGSSGAINLLTGNSLQTSGTINILTGTGAAGSQSGDVVVETGGFNGSGGTGSGNITISSGVTVAGGASTGEVDIGTGDNSGTGSTGPINIVTGIATNGGTGEIYVQTGDSTAITSGQISLFTGNGAGQTGDVYLSTGASSGAASGVIRIETGTAATDAQKGSVDMSNIGKLLIPQTITAGGTTGNQTIDKISGTVNIAAAGSSVTVTCNRCTTSSIVFATIRTNDTTAVIKNVVPGSGSFVIRTTAAVTAETSIGFFVLN